MIDIDIQDKRFCSGSTPVFSDFKLSLKRGEFVALIGPSGVGKSTLLQMVSGLDNSYTGKISIAEVDGSPARIGYMFQESLLMPWLSALENIRLVLDDDRGAAIRALEAVGMADCAELYPKQLSGGMSRRMALARSFAVCPDVLLMDEPFVSLDEPNANKMRQLLLQLWQETRPTVLFVTHNIEEAITLADRLVFLSTSPATVALDTPVALPRPRPAGTNISHAYRQELLSAYPDILTGGASG